MRAARFIIIFLLFASSALALCEESTQVSFDYENTQDRTISVRFALFEKDDAVLDVRPDPDRFTIAPGEIMPVVFTIVSDGSLREATVVFDAFENGFLVPEIVLTGEFSCDAGGFNGLNGIQLFFEKLGARAFIWALFVFVVIAALIFLVFDTRPKRSGRRVREQREVATHASKRRERLDIDAMFRKHEREQGVTNPMPLWAWIIIIIGVLFLIATIVYAFLLILA